MSVPQVFPVKEPITWDFVLTDQGFTTQYGHAHVFYYKQVLQVRGGESQIHKPRRIDSKMYQFARRMYDQRQAAS